MIPLAIVYWNTAYGERIWLRGETSEGDADAYGDIMLCSERLAKEILKMDAYGNIISPYASVFSISFASLAA